MSKSEKKDDPKPKLVIRRAKLSDVSEIIKLANRVYPDQPPYTHAMIRGQINNFPEGQFVAVFERTIVGYAATFKISGTKAMKNHTWEEITGNGYASTHEKNGDYLYGLEVCVDREYRGLRIGNRLYRERKRLCQYLRLKGIIFGGGIPGYKKNKKRVSSPNEYIDLVKNRKIRDTTLNFQLRNGFEILGILKNYLPTDTLSEGNAVHLIWRNPQVEQVDNKGKSKRPQPNIIRVATVQYKQRKVQSFEQFKQYIEYFVDVVASYQSDFITFPEMITLQLLSLEERKLTPAQSIEALTSYTEPYKTLMSELAIKYNINIIGGSHPTKLPEGDVQNVCYVFLRDGSIHQQVKIHPTPDEKYWWNISGGSELVAIPTDCGPIGILICYDSEFPELSRHLINQGARIIFVPFCTDERQGYLRVRYCSQARAVENQCYVVLSGNVGNLPGVENMDIQYAQSCILTPCDFAFSRDGIACDTTPNVETVAFADLRLEDLLTARSSGTVQNLKDRRHDLYSVSWRGI